jgi:hypothetical protein
MYSTVVWAVSELYKKKLQQNIAAVSGIAVSHCGKSKIIFGV